MQKLFQYFLKRKDFNLSYGANAVFTKSVHQGKQRQTSEKGGGGGERVWKSKENFVPFTANFAIRVAIQGGRWC